MTDNSQNETNKVVADKANLTQAELQKQIIMQQLMQQKAGAGAINQNPNNKQNFFIRFASQALKKCEGAIYYIDKFINFIVKKDDPDRNDVMQTARYPILFGFWIVLIFVVVGLIWSGTAPLDSAATAVGTVMVSSHKQEISSPSPGIVKHIYVRQGDFVTANQPLVELDETQSKANFQVYLGSFRLALAQESRLEAERDDKTEIEFDQFLLNDQHKPEVAKILQVQRSLLKSKQEAFDNAIKALFKQIDQVHQKIEVLKSKKKAYAYNLTIMESKKVSYSALYNQKVISKEKWQEFEKAFVGAQTEVATNDIEILQSQQEVSKLEIELSSKKSQNLANVIKELRENQVYLNESREKYTQSKDSLTKTVIRSPVEGIINKIEVHTIGGVINAGTPIVEVTPFDGPLVVDARIPSKEIESLRVGLKAKLRFSAFKSRTTPTFNGTVVYISPDTIVDQIAQRQMQSGMISEYFYTARIEIDMDEFNKVAKAKKIKLLPGMQAEIQIVRGTRTLLQYLLDPVTDNMFKAFKEK